MGRREKRTLLRGLEQAIEDRTAELDMLIENGLMMAMERDRSRLLRQIVESGKRLLNCDCATLYLIDDATLRFAVRTRDDPLPALGIPLVDPESGRANDNHASVHVALHNRSVRIDDVYSETRFDLSGTRHFDSASGYRTVSMLTVPVAIRGGEVVGVLQFINAKDRQTGRFIPFSVDLTGLVEALAAQAAVALDNLKLIESHKALMESMIRVLATAIDAKSPYTGRHCERVPELAIMLAQAASECTEGSLAEFSFETEDEWQEFRIGAWLHDCGKVTTPEYVIDKATKLETIHNRIHEIRTRFEVLLRDAKIERLERLLAGAEPDEAERRFELRCKQLHEDFAFVAQCNIGSEAMSSAHVERLTRIAGTPWSRHFDDRLGLSPGEQSRCGDERPASLPVAETLLADKPRDIVPRPAGEALDPRFGFRMQAPEHLYNRGELYNLSVSKGTLTEEERYKINEHMVHTIMMLERMPFPKWLQRVPEYAGTHHETLDGRGYPRRLAADELSVPARVMAIADIVEALTAADRPYKREKKLSEAVEILYRMKEQRKIDPDLFSLLLTSGVLERYAQRYLSPEQIDDVEIWRYVQQAQGAVKKCA